MKRDWDVIRQVLTEIETTPSSERTNLTYGVGAEYPAEHAAKSEHALLLWKAGFISAIQTTTYGGRAILSPELTWQGHELLDTIRSKPVWERIKTTAEEKGIELTLDSVKALGKVALDWILAN
jgi:hypothetical protein